MGKPFSILNSMMGKAKHSAAPVLGIQLVTDVCSDEVIELRSVYAARRQILPMNAIVIVLVHGSKFYVNPLGAIL